MKRKILKGEELVKSYIALAYFGLGTLPSDKEKRLKSLTFVRDTLSEAIEVIESKPKKRIRKTEVKKKLVRKVRTSKALYPKYMQLYKVSPELEEIIGKQKQHIPRTKVVSLLWDYIKKNNLQNPKNRREILCNDALAKVLKKKKVSLFDLASLVSKHILKKEE